MMEYQDKEFNTIVHFLSIPYVAPGFSTNQNKHLVIRAADFTLIVGHLYKLGVDGIMCHCVFYYERPWVMSEAHAGVIGGHYVRKETMHKILQAGYGGKPYTWKIRASAGTVISTRGHENYLALMRCHLH